MINNTSPPENESATTLSHGARKVKSSQNQAQHRKPFNDRDYEDRRNAAACFRNKDKKEDWHADYQGVAVVEGLRDGDKVWANVRESASSKGDRYVSVTLKRQEK